MNSIVITGASGSMGAAAVKAMAAKGCPVIMACRNLKKGESVRQGIMKEIPDARLELMELDLESPESIEAFANELEGRKLAGIFNNAGVISRGYRTTADGLEQSLAVNYIGLVRLTLKLLDMFEQDARIVNMVSLTTRFVKPERQGIPGTPGNTGSPKKTRADILHPQEKDFKRLRNYSRSKYALLLFSIELERRLRSGLLGAELQSRNIHVNVADPGIVDSNMISMGKWFDPLADLLFRPFCKSPEKGAAPAVRALCTEESGKYFVGNKIKAAPKRLTGSFEAEDLWGRTMELIGSAAGLLPVTEHLPDE